MQNSASPLSCSHLLSARLRCFSLHLLAAVLLASALPVAHAQTPTSGVPGLISYQGTVLDNTASPVGTGVPVNRKVTFRIWDHQSNTLDANLLYSEEQTVTISDGKFSVLIGQGIATTTNLFGYSETAKGPSNNPIANVFNGANRYLGVTVDDDTPAVDNEIAPRQQIVSSSFAIRAKYAETLGTATNTALTVLDSGNVGVGNPAAPARFTVTGANTGTSSGTIPQVLVTDSADTSKGLRLGVDSTGNGTGFLQSFKTGTGAQPLLLNPNGGNVGINVSSANVALEIGGGVRAAQGIFASTGYTFSAPGNTNGGLFSTSVGLHLITDVTNSNAGRLTVNNAGNVVIGTGSADSIDARLLILAPQGTRPLQATVGGVTKFMVDSNGGVSFGSGDTPPANGVLVKGKVGIGMNALPVATLEVGFGTAVASGGYISAGPFGGSRVAIDTQSIQRYSGSSPQVLNLNQGGGDVVIGGSSSATVIAGNLTVGTSSTTATTTIHGPVRIPGLIVQGTTAGKGLLTRRVESVAATNNDDVALSNGFALRRDGTAGGFKIVSRVASSPRQAVVARGVTASGATSNRTIFPSAGNQLGATWILYTNAENVVQFTVDFGNPYDMVDQTSVTLMRHLGSHQWTGTLTSTLNQ